MLELYLTEPVNLTAVGFAGLTFQLQHFSVALSYSLTAQSSSVSSVSPTNVTGSFPLDDYVAVILGPADLVRLLFPFRAL